MQGQHCRRAVRGTAVQVVADTILIGVLNAIQDSPEELLQDAVTFRRGDYAMMLAGKE